MKTLKQMPEREHDFHADEPERKQNQQQPPAPSRPVRRSRRGIVILAVFVVLAVAGYFAWTQFFATTRVPDNIVLLSGRIEGDDSAVAPKTSGRILEIRVREGDSVRAGDTIAVLDDQQVRAREDQSRAALLQAEARAKSSHDQIAVLEEQLQQGQAEVAQQEASYQLALFDKEAYTRLAKTGAVSERQGKQAESTA